MAGKRIGIDLGGTKIELIVLAATGEIVYRQRQPTPQGDYETTLDCIQQMVTDAEAKFACHCSVGIGTPGAIDKHSQRLKNSNSVCLNGMPIRTDLEQRLKRQIRLANDADCFALSEASDGAGQAFDSVFGVIVGTGTGGGIVVNKRLLQGPNAIAGEWGHNQMPWLRPEELPGPACYCGKQGCIETLLSGPGLSHLHYRMTGQKVDAKQLANRIDQPDIQPTFAAYYDLMARALAAVINILDPEVIVLGGGLSNISQLYTEVPKRWQQYVFSSKVDSLLYQARHGDSSGVRGAAWLWPAAEDI